MNAKLHKCGRLGSEGVDHIVGQMSQSSTISNGLANLSIGNSAYVGDDEDEDPDDAVTQPAPKKKGKAQKRREKAEKAHLERLEKQVRVSALKEFRSNSMK